MDHTGLDPFTKEPVQVATAMHNRKLQRAPIQFFKPENYVAVREALLQVGRPELIGDGCDCLIPGQPQKESLESRRKHANRMLRADYYHAVPNPAKSKQPTPVANRGYRPRRQSQRRRDREGGS